MCNRSSVVDVPAMGTGTEKAFGNVAVEAQNLKPRRESLFPNHVIESGATNLSGFPEERLAVSRPIIVNVIQSQEIQFCFATTYTANAAIRIEGFDLQLAIVSLGCFVFLFAMIVAVPVAWLSFAFPAAGGTKTKSYSLRSPRSV